ncbi:MAG: aminotransferase class V-fold PLP-dependent enzyme [Trueperaceae bacterium]|nr:aminotransferase class V-fold PLP-dependent enzyme [Trueperaceae bacterium]
MTTNLPGRVRSTDDRQGHDRHAYDDAFYAFARRWPGYASEVLDTDRRDDFARLDRRGDVYLDYTGAGLYPESLVRAHADRLTSGTFGNPHSTNPTSLAATERVEAARRAVLAHVRADPDAYVVVFTPNASGALKLVAESFSFGPGGTYLLTYDNHNSVNGIREFARGRGADVVYAPVRPPEMRIDEDGLLRALEATSDGAPRLFAYPAQSNFSGVLHPLTWVARARERGWSVLLDAAAFAPTHALDLAAVQPDFVSLSFYKMFGFPTGVGALVARREALAAMRRPWFAGGTIAFAAVTEPRHDLLEGAEAFEDGTLNFLALPAVEDGLARLGGGRQASIDTRAMALTAWTLEQLLALHHPTGHPVVQVYGPTTADGRGSVVAFNVQDASGALVDHREVERRANEARISLRTGCFCNPGAGEAALGISSEELTGCFATHDRMTIDAFRGCLSGKGSGAVRVSYGWASTFGDAYALVELIRSFATDPG